MLRVESLVLSYGKIQAVSGVSFRVGERELVAVIGANGAGKTTLLNAIIGLKRAERGRIAFRGQDITRLPPWERAGLGIGIVPEGGRVFPELSVEENLRMGAYRERDRRTVRERREWVFSLFGVLRDRRRQLAGTLSGGERQMLAIARALMGGPRLLLVDEISTGLMPRLVPEVFATISRLREEGLSVFLAEQNVQEAMEVVDRVLVMENGRIVLRGTPEELAADDRIRAAYLGL